MRALGIHAHNDTEQAVAVQLAAIRAGARQVQGTLNGLGERCGNANLCSLLPNLMLKEPYASQFETGVSARESDAASPMSRGCWTKSSTARPTAMRPMSGRRPSPTRAGCIPRRWPKDPQTYEHVPPEAVGNKRVIPVSDQSGRSNVAGAVWRSRHRYRRQGRADLARLLEDVKQREYPGYAYDGAEASFELLARRAAGQVPRLFHGGAVSASRWKARENRDGEFVTASKGVVELKVAGEKLHNVGTGNGPVNALDAALRKDLGKYSSFLADLRLVDYKVRILTSGTEAVTRVMVESADGKGNRWSTVGVSANIVDASFEALTDSIIYKLYRDKAPSFNSAQEHSARPRASSSARFRRRRPGNRASGSSPWRSPP